MFSSKTTARAGACPSHSHLPSLLWIYLYIKHYNIYIYLIQRSVSEETEPREKEPLTSTEKNGWPLVPAEARQHSIKTTGGTRSSEKLPRFKLPVYLNRSFSHDRPGRVIKKQHKTKKLVQSSPRQNYLFLSLISLIIPPKMFRLFPISISPFVNFSFMCFTHFSANTFVIFFLISKSSFLRL